MIAARILGMVIAVGLSFPVAAQEPSFEVASVKPNVSGSRGTQLKLPGGGRFVAVNVSLRELIHLAYQVQDYEIVGAPDWVKNAHFDITARADRDIVLTTLNPAGGPPPVFLMLRSLLADRFKLAVHRETREMPVYALVMARDDKKPGPRLTPSTTDCAAVMAAARAVPPAQRKPPGPGTTPTCGAANLVGRIAAGALPITQLAGMLSGRMGRVVIDRTGLKGVFDLVVDFTPDQMPQGPPGSNAPPPMDASAPSLQTALEEQLGIKLESTRAPVEVLVVDSVSQPTPD